MAPFPAEIAAEYDLTEAQTYEALTFYDAYRQEIDAAITAKVSLGPKAHGWIAAAFEWRILDV
jgi:hypothetical protein